MCFAFCRFKNYLTKRIEKNTSHRGLCKIFNSVNTIEKPNLSVDKFIF